MKNLNIPKKNVQVLKVKEKTLTVQEITEKEHPKYEKKFRVTKKYSVHCEDSKIKIGDWIVILGDRPRSAQKRWRFFEKIQVKGNKHD